MEGWRENLAKVLVTRQWACLPLLWNFADRGPFKSRQSLADGNYRGEGGGFGKKHFPKSAKGNSTQIREGAGSTIDVEEAAMSDFG